MVYIFSDGYADQFGGPKGKKFLYRRFRELLAGDQRLPTGAPAGPACTKPSTSGAVAHEQVDDILVIGMRA